MSLLSIVQSVAQRVLKNTPSAAVSNIDTSIQQLIGLVNEEGQELAARYSWQALRKEASFTTMAAESQGTIQAITGADFNFIVNETMWNRSQRRPVFGPRTAQEWQQLKAQFMQGPWIQYMLRQNLLLFLPVPSAGFQINFEWISKYWCTNNVGTPSDTMTQDADLSLLDERLIKLGALWRFKKSNRLEYEEDWNVYEAAVTDAIGRDGSKGRLNLEGAQADVYPGVVVPVGNWIVGP